MWSRLLLVLLVGAARPAFPAPKVEGDYDSPLGKVKVSGDGVTFEGRLVTAGKGVPYAVGEPVLRATLLDDSLAGTVRLPLKEAATCNKREVWASAVLLVAGRGLTGAVHLPRGCRGPVGVKGGFAFSRASTVEARLDPKANRGEKPDEAPRPRARDPKGEKNAVRERARALMRDGGDYLAEGQFEKARKRFLDALEEDASVPEAYNGVGVTYRMRNEFARALDWYKKALAVDPDFGDAYYNMACVYAIRGEKELALRYLQIAALNGYTTAEIMDHDSDLESLRGEEAYRVLLGQKR